MTTTAEQEAYRQARTAAVQQLERKLAGWNALPEDVRELYVNMHVAGAVTARQARPLTPEERRRAREATAAAQALRAEKQRLKTERRAYYRHSDLRSEAGVGETLAQRQAAKRLQMRLQVPAMRAEEDRKRRDAERIFRAAGLPIRGKGWSVQTTSFGIPQICGTYNVTAAQTTSTNRIKPGGALGFNLDGTGTTLGIWDFGDVRVSHTEFTTGGARAFDRDGVSTDNITDHATHVAGTMIAEGVDTNAQGMSHEANLDTHDYHDHFSEMTDAVTNLLTSDNLQISNHSYGFFRGWNENHGGSTGWSWVGETTISATEDFLFGFYDDHSQEMDEIAYRAKTYLPVWGAGNERGNPGPTTQPEPHWALVNNAWGCASMARRARWTSSPAATTPSPSLWLPRTSSPWERWPTFPAGIPPQPTSR